MCQSPEWYRTDILPRKFKDEVVIPAYQQHLDWLESQDPLKRATSGYQSMMNFIAAQDLEHLLPRFREEIEKLDTIRNENFWNTFPELLPLK